MMRRYSTPMMPTLLCGLTLWAQFGGYLRLTNEEWTEVRKEYVNFPKEARESLEFQRDGYWDAERFIKKTSRKQSG